MENTTFSIPNISCGHCVRTIETELSEIDGILTVTGDADSKKVTVDWDRPATIKVITEKLAEIGYPAGG